MLLPPSSCMQIMFVFWTFWGHYDWNIKGPQMPHWCTWKNLCTNFNSILHVCIGVSMCMLRLVNISPKKRLYFALQSPLYLCKIWSCESQKTSVIFIILESYKTWQCGCFYYYESSVVGYRMSINVWDGEHLPFSLGIHLWSILILISLVWRHGSSVKWWFTMFTLCWICIKIGWYYKWTLVMPSIRHHEQPFFKMVFYQYRLVFLFVSWFYVWPSPLYLLHVFWHENFTCILFKFYTQHGDPLGGMLFTLVHICAFHLTIVAHLTCVFLSFIDDMHIVGLVLDVVLVFLWLHVKF